MGTSAAWNAIGEAQRAEKVRGGHISRWETFVRRIQKSGEENLWRARKPGAAFAAAPRICAGRRTRGLIYGDGASTAGRWKFGMSARKRSGVGVRGGPPPSPVSETGGRSEMGGRGEREADSGRSRDLPQSRAAVSRPVFSLVKAAFPRLGTSSSLTPHFQPE